MAKARVFLGRGVSLNLLLILVQVIVEKAEKSDIPDIDKKK